MSSELEQFIAWLQSNLTHFVAITEEGSVVSGDPWQEGFSDHDLPIVVSQDLQSEMKAVYSYLEKHPLGDEYLVGLRLYNEYLVGNSLNDLSLKFRSKTIGGKDVVSEKAKPDQEAAIKIGLDGLNGLSVRFERRWLNLAHWSLEYAQKKNYEIFKNFFVFYSALSYGRTGNYPTTRAKAAKLLPNQEAADVVLSVTNDIAHADKDSQKAAIEAALGLISSIVS